MRAEKYDERASSEEERKGEGTHLLRRSLSVQEHRNSWHPKKFFWIGDQSRRVFIEASRVEKFSRSSIIDWSPGIGDRAQA
jgi:hypothetical protein